MNKEKFDKELLEIILKFKNEGKLKLKPVTQKNDNHKIFLCPELVIAIYRNPNGNGTIVQYITGKNYTVINSPENIKNDLGI